MDPMANTNAFVTVPAMMSHLDTSRDLLFSFYLRSLLSFPTDIWTLACTLWSIIGTMTTF